MTQEEIDEFLAGTLDDLRLSRNERQALAEFAASLGPEADRQSIRRRAFEAARSALKQPDDRAVIDWLEDVFKAINEPGEGGHGHSLAEAHFSPGDDCRQAISQLLRHASRTADICVFTITDDRLAAEILGAHRRGVQVRIIADDSKAEDLGSDVGRLEQAGIPVRLDRSPFHMHHKFAILDGARLLTGSYNWTRGAASDNEENLVVTDDVRLVSPFAATFAHLWSKLA
jgi:mitochondrial cardiolipin hydrolase